MNKIKIYLLISTLSVQISACTQNLALNALSNLTSTKSSPSPTAAPGSRAFKIIFSLSPQGSFDSASVPGSGTIVPLSSAGIGSFRLGLQPIQVFNPDNSIQGTRTYNSDTTVATTTNWPNWLTSFDIGISGANNNSAPSPYCATFANSTEQSATNCKIGPVSAPTPTSCGAAAGQFRVSEVDCTMGSSPALTGIGGPFDGVYFRAVFNRSTSVLASYENILVVLEYMPASLNPAPANPSTCFLPITGQFSAEACSDFVWRAYLKHTMAENTTSASISIQPYFLLIPPMLNSVLGGAQAVVPTSGANPMARQFILPLATDPTLSILQISRTKSNFPNSSLLGNYCTNGGLGSGGANSPLCAGVVFYSITFYRI